MQDLFFELGKVSLIGTLFALMVMALRFVFRKAPKWIICLLWGLVALRLLCPFSVESPFSLMPEGLASGQMVHDVSDKYIGDPTAIYITNGKLPEEEQKPLISYIVERDTLLPAKTVGNTLFPILGWVWLAGVVLMVSYMAVSYLVLRKRLEEATRLRDNIWQSEQVESPFVLGIFKPRIYLPYGIAEADMASVLAHEQAHICRRDHWWKSLGFLVLSLHWFNPVLWVAYILLCRDIEAACDEKVIRHMEKEALQAYSLALLRCSVRRRVGACPLAFGEVGVKTRVKAVMGYKKPAVWAVTAAAVVCIAVGVCLLTDPVGSHYGQVERITKEAGYTITDQQRKQITLSLSTAYLSEEIYSEEGLQFRDRQIPVYEEEGNLIYLKGVRRANEGKEYLYFYFGMDYALPKDSGQLIYPCVIHDKYVSMAATVESRALKTETQTIENAVSFRGQDAKWIWLYVSAEAMREVEGDFTIDIGLNQISYLKDGVTPEPVLQ